MNCMKSTEQGWVKLHRQILEWEWFDDPNTFRLFIYCLLKANHTDKKYMGVTIKRGTFVTSLEELSKDTKLSVRSVRTCLTRLESTNEVTSLRSFKGTVIQIVKYDDYQVTTNQTTTKRQASDKPTTTTKNDKEIKEEYGEPLCKWIDYRKGIKKPLTDYSLKQLAQRVEREGVQKATAIINLSIENGWQGLFWEKYNPDDELRPLTKGEAVAAMNIPATMEVFKAKGYTEEQIKHYAK